MSERDVVDVVEDRLVHPVRSPDGERPFAVALLDRWLVEAGSEVGDEGVCDHHRPQPATASVPGDPVHRVGHDAVVGGPSPRRGEVIRVIGIVGGAVVERAGNRQRVEERDGVDRDGPTVVAAAGVGDHDRIGQPGRI